MSYLNLALYSILWLLIASPAHAQTCIPQWCSAPWPPPAGDYSTAGLDNCKETCVKQGSATGYQVGFSSGGTMYHWIIDADMIIIAPSYLVFKKDGKEVARFDRKYVIGWRVNV